MDSKIYIPPIKIQGIKTKLIPLIMENIDIDNQTIPRICFGKYTLNNDKYEMMLNISVSHIFVDGLHLSKVFNKVNELLDDVEDILK